MDWDNLGKYSIKQLKKILADRGMECKSCTEKSHLIQEAEKARNAPLKPKTAKPAPKGPATPESFDPSKMTSEELMAYFNKKQSQEEKDKREIVEKLKAQGIHLADGSFLQFSRIMAVRHLMTCKFV